MVRRPRALFIAFLVRFGAALGLVQTYAVSSRWNRGPEARWVEPLRRVASRTLGTHLDSRTGPRPITEGEYAGRLPTSLDDAEELLWRRGFVRNPFSRLKVRDGQAEAGSWVYREGPFARRQVHVMLFPDGTGVDVYAHEEFSSVHPLVSHGHIDGTDQQVARGVERARAMLPLDESEAPDDPPEGAWHVAAVGP